MEFAIETHALTKHFGDVIAVDRIELRVRPGEIYGFLGLNGAGKTTTIRALLGMIRPSSGSVTVLGQPIGAQQPGPWKKIGHLVEAPSAYPDLTVRENLEIARRLQGIDDVEAVPRVMEKLGIQAYTDRQAGTLSSGNLQRLGLARALLHEPELLILDEPANGLDPAGVVEIREMLFTLASQLGVTVFMSSHILTEVDRLANRIGIIHHGRLIEELDSNQLERLRLKHLKLKTRDLTTSQAALQSAGWEPVLQGQAILMEETLAIEHPEEIAKLLVAANTPPTHLAVEQEGLEDHFLRLTGEPLPINEI